MIKNDLHVVLTSDHEKLLGAELLACPHMVKELVNSKNFMIDVLIGRFLGGREHNGKVCKTEAAVSLLENFPGIEYRMKAIIALAENCNVIKLLMDAPYYCGELEQINNVSDRLAYLRHLAVEEYQAPAYRIIVETSTRNIGAGITAS